MQAQELLAWHQPGFAFGASQAQYEAPLNFIPPLEKPDSLLAVWEGGGGNQANDAECPH